MVVLKNIVDPPDLCCAVYMLELIGDEAVRMSKMSGMVSIIARLGTLRCAFRPTKNLANHFAEFLVCPSLDLLF